MSTRCITIHNYANYYLLTTFLYKNKTTLSITCLQHLSKTMWISFLLFHLFFCSSSFPNYCFTDLMLKGILESGRPGFDSCFCHGSFSWSSHTSDFKIGTPVAILPGTGHYRVSTGTGFPSVRILWLGEIERSATSNAMWQRVQLSKQICPWDTQECCWDIKQQTNNIVPQVKSWGSPYRQDFAFATVMPPDR